MISAEAPVLFAKAAEIFINELSLRAWVHTEDNKRRTLQRNDIAMAITKYDMFDFLIDIVPRDDLKPSKRQVWRSFRSCLEPSTLRRCSYILRYTVFQTCSNKSRIPSSFVPPYRLIHFIKYVFLTSKTRSNTLNDSSK